MRNEDITQKTIETIIIHDINIKQKTINAIIECLDETIYLSDIEKDESEDYVIFFYELYDFFESKNITKYYFEILSNYIFNCCSLTNYITIKELKNNLDLLLEYNKIIRNGNKITKDEIDELKSNKIKTLTSN